MEFVLRRKERASPFSLCNFGSQLFSVGLSFLIVDQDINLQARHPIRLGCMIMKIKSCLCKPCSSLQEQGQTQCNVPLRLDVNELVPGCMTLRTWNPSKEQGTCLRVLGTRLRGLQVAQDGKDARQNLLHPLLRVQRQPGLPLVLTVVATISKEKY